jgi:SAM-dependent methyltransferase
MDNIISGFLRRVRQSITSASTGKKKKGRTKINKLSFEEWQAQNPTGSFKDYSACLPFEEWQALNPGGTFKEYYVGSVVDALAGKKRHATLGPLTQEGAVERGENVAQTLIDLGVSTSDLVVDYGCGTLRVGRKMIKYLEASRFVGLDVDRRILDTGLSLLPLGLAEQKSPILEVIDDEVLDRIAALRPNWIYCKGVLHHVPPSELEEFLGSIGRLADPETRIVIWARLSDSGTEQASNRTWYHDIDGVASLARELGLDVEICRDAESRRMLRLQRSALVT